MYGLWDTVCLRCHCGITSRQTPKVQWGQGQKLRAEKFSFSFLLLGWIDAPTMFKSRGFYNENVWGTMVHQKFGIPKGSKLCPELPLCFSSKLPCILYTLLKWYPEIFGPVGELVVVLTFGCSSHLPSTADVMLPSRFTTSSQRGSNFRSCHHSHLCWWTIVWLHWFLRSNGPWNVLEVCVISYSPSHLHIIKVFF